MYVGGGGDALVLIDSNIHIVDDFKHSFKQTEFMGKMYLLLKGEGKIMRI